MQKGAQELSGWIKEGKLDVSEGEDVHEVSVEGIPGVWQKLFTGQNKGKLITRLA